MMSGMESTHNDLKVYLEFNEFDPGKQMVQPHISWVYIFLLPPPMGGGRNMREVEKGKFGQASETCKIYLFLKL